MRRQHDHFDDDRQGRREINVLMSGQKRDQRGGRRQKRGLQRKQVHTGRQPTLRHDGKTTEQQQDRAEIDEL
jgi:hypothetical protein